MTPEEQAVIDAALIVADDPNWPVPDYLHVAVGALLKARWAAEVTDPLIWVPRTWRDVRAGDTVRPPGTGATYAGATVHTVAPRRFHVDPRSSEYSSVPLEYEAIGVRFEPNGPMREMNPGAAVEIQLAAGEVQFLDQQNAWSDRVATIEREED